MTSRSTKANGSPKMIVVYCRVVMPPITSMATVSRPVADAQRIRCQGAQSCCTSRSLEQRFPITNAPESAEVT